MITINTTILFFVGFYLLIKGARILIDGASSVARIFNISHWIVGVVIVGIGTSIPELSINLASLYNGMDIGLGTIVGSNIFNTLFILGLSAIIFPLYVSRSWVLRDFFLNFLSVIVAGSVILFPLLGDQSFNGITQEEGLLLLATFLLWMWYMVWRRRNGDEEETTDYKTFAFLTSFFMIIGGILGVFFGGKWVVEGAEALALFFGVSDSLIGLTLISIGTSVPELTVSVSAIIKRERAIAVGNIIGSNIFDFLGILGIIASFGAISFPQDLILDVIIVLVATILLFVSMFVGRRYELSRAEGLIFIFLYILYLVFLFIRQ